LCAQDPQRISALASSFEGPSLTTRTYPALAARLAENAAIGEITAPVVVAQGLDDLIIPPRATDDYVQGQCATGQQLAYWTFWGKDHATLVQPGSTLEAPLVAWTQARFARAPVERGCTRASM